MEELSWKMENITLSSENKKEHKENQDNLEQEEEDHQILKTRISHHPLYTLLLQSHLDCLKVGGNVQLKMKNSSESRHLKQQGKNCCVEEDTQIELDQFMEAYCIALGMLKEELEEPQQKSMAFIKRMHSQLTQLSGESQEGTKSERPEF